MFRVSAMAYPTVAVISLMAAVNPTQKRKPTLWNKRVGMSAGSLINAVCNPFVPGQR